MVISIVLIALTLKHKLCHNKLCNEYHDKNSIKLLGNYLFIQIFIRENPDKIFLHINWITIKAIKNPLNPVFQESYVDLGETQNELNHQSQDKSQ